MHLLELHTKEDLSGSVLKIFKYVGEFKAKDINEEVVKFCKGTGLREGTFWIAAFESPKNQDGEYGLKRVYKFTASPEFTVSNVSLTATIK